LLRTLRAHQLILATRMESTDEGMTHATWIPLDLSTVPAQNCCFGPSLLAAGISCMTTAIRLAPTSGGLSPNDWIARSQAGGLRRMLTARIGFATSIASDNFLQWRTLSPYRTGQIESGDLSPWREVSLRGLQLKETGNRIIQFANSASGTERPMDLFESTSHSDSTVTYPRMQPGSRVSVMPQLADQPVRLHIDFGSPTYCAQSPTVHVASLLDAPGDKAVEWKRLRNLVDSFKSNRLGSPLEGIESDQWMEFMESGQRNLADPVLGT
uniref:Sulfatase domain-containing protein n=1 Tax=Echinostoma caproni TaxID=27848 RepID=A0A183BE21_9TREM